MEVKEVRDMETKELKGYLLDGMFVPLDPGNRHYNEIMDWISEGNTPLPGYTLDELKEYKLAKLKKEFEDFICSHYNQGTQASFLSLYQIAKDSGNTDVINEIQKVWDWISSVMAYYYQTKNEIRNAETEEALDEIIWDWGVVEETEHVELEYVVSLLNNPPQE